MKNITLEELLEAGCHFGHQVTRQNPKARDYIFETRDGIHIIDLTKTKEGLDEAADFVKRLASRPDSSMIILGAKRQAQQVVREEVERAKIEEVSGLYSVTSRWIGGILTNFPEISKNFKRLKDLSEKLADKKAQVGYTKKEVSLWEKERQKLLSFYGGIYELNKVPDALFIIDSHLEDLAVREANSMHLSTVGITDTNADPTVIAHAIPANDDAVGSIKLIVHHIVDAWIEGAKLRNGMTEVATSERKTNGSDTKNSKTAVEEAKKARVELAPEKVEDQAVATTKKTARKKTKAEVAA